MYPSMKKSSLSIEEICLDKPLVIFSAKLTRLSDEVGEVKLFRSAFAGWKLHDRGLDVAADYRIAL